MTSYQKFGLYAGQLFIGLGAAVIGFIPGVLIGEEYRLSSTLMLNGIIGSSITLFIAVIADGYIFLKREGRKNEFVKHFIKGLIGFIMGIYSFYYIIWQNDGFGVSDELFALIGITLPLAGIIIGFDLNLINDNKMD